MPTTPHRAAGWRTEPPVSDPRARGTNPAATAAADPPEEPPGTLLRSCGLRVGPKAEFSVDEPMANSSRLVLPTATAPAATCRATTVALYGGRQPSRIREAHVVGTPRVHRLSFRATGTPASGPGSSPPAGADSSTAEAAARPPLRPSRARRRPRDVAVAGGDGGQGLLHHLGGRAGLGPHGGGQLQRSAHGASPTDAAAPWKRPSSRPPLRGRPGQGLVLGQALPGARRPGRHCAHGKGWAVGAKVRQVEGGHVPRRAR